jgi:glycosyltransferase involved in cell wall biosynthesis
MVIGDRFMSKSPTLSIIVPCYNHARFLPERLKSISDQSFGDFEIILLDDASTDNSQSVLQAYADQEKRVSETLFNDKNGGCVNEQWLKGVRIAKGEYIWIAESDDVAAPEFLQVLLQQFNAFPEIGMAYCDSMIIDDSGKTQCRYDYSHSEYQNLWHEDFVLDGRAFIREHLMFQNVIPNASAVVFKKENLLAALTQNNMKYSADYYCYIRLLSNSAIAYVCKPLNLFRAHVYTTRWHSQESYSAAVKEKVIILKEIKQLNIPKSAENLAKSYHLLFKHRHKFRRLGKLFTDLHSSVRKTDQVALYGFNDISEYVLEAFFPQIQFAVIIDKKTSVTAKKGVPVRSLSKSLIFDIDVVVVCSFNYKAEMCSNLDAQGFKGRVITV